MPSKSFKFLAVAFAGLLLLAACSSDGESVATDATPVPVSESEAAEEPTDDVTPAAPECESSADDGADPVTADDKPTVDVPEGEPPTELVVVDLVEGDGDEAMPGDLVSAHYVGVLFADGTEFDASWNRGEPFQFPLGQGRVITGWDQGIEGMKEGGRRMLVIPSELAYGESGSGDVIGPDAALVFVVDLVKVLESPDPADEPEVEVPAELPTELVVEDVIEGDGREVAPGCEVTLHYVLALGSTGEVAQSSWGAEPVTVPIGTGTVIPGWDEGLMGMKEGGRRLLVVPPDMAFGAEGNGPVPPDETLVFVIDVLEVG